ncbi:hypothetical protein KBZ94_42070 [Streptomyces sp. RM72]|uniref:hypothetical protein n=1 Tax=Streptomyces sp. RM72 TaxID=1115510 RepID=UPI001B35EC83|nr:hypothetical protein [Streptomyces sp. RM72]MBQ0891411.1 hypothetical protein [Streptomyces sp. RM72]
MLHKAAALERRDHAPADDGTSPERLVLLICNEIQHVFLAAMDSPPATSPIDCAGPPDADVIESAPNAAVIDAKATLQS